ncbi:hypothetical protein PanWU01x14_015970 [Parasponia andersonii]|uniref:Uncharacterized protein n=1 Tax=Parasponia andersonii TaxID=3476 RepID=A0A2P5E0Q4_PARAD|nr:hypothetical protein PanWU01x14_015970 [Parasponia andersonii]
MSSNDYYILNRPCPMQFSTPTDVGKRSATPASSQSRHLHGGTSKGCQNYVILKGILEAECKARRKSCKNYHEAREQCLDAGYAEKMANVWEELAEESSGHVIDES